MQGVAMHIDARRDLSMFSEVGSKARNEPIIRSSGVHGRDNCSRTVDTGLFEKQQIKRLHSSRRHELADIDERWLAPQILLRIVLTDVSRPRGSRAAVL
jgi:hypothetical protein